MPFSGNFKESFEATQDSGSHYLVRLILFFFPRKSTTPDLLLFNLAPKKKKKKKVTLLKGQSWAPPRKLKTTSPQQFPGKNLQEDMG